MAYCSRCGTSVSDDSRFCPFCGQSMREKNNTQGPGGSVWDNYSSKTQEDGFDAMDVEENRLFSILCYLNVLVFVPLLLKPNSPFARYHCNQGLLLLIIWIAAVTLGRFVPLVGWLIQLAGWLFTVGCAILGIMNALAGRAKPLPVIGSYRIV